MRAIIILAGVWLGATGVSAVALADPLDECTRSRSLEARVRGCSQVIADANATGEQKALAYRIRGLARADAGAREQAIADLGEAIRLNGSDAWAYSGRASARLARGETDAAIGDLTAALQIAPRSVPFLIGRGHAHLVKGNADLAIADFTEAIRVDPNSASAFNNRGLAYRRKNDNDAAIADYTSAIAINPIHALAYANRGNAYESKGMGAEAIADFTRALQLDQSIASAAAGLKRLKADQTLQAEIGKLVRDGKALVEASCARCHAVGASGASPNPKAPEFRQLNRRHPIQALREPLSRSIAAPHDEMPSFALPASDIDKIVAYINSLPAAPSK